MQENVDDVAINLPLIHRTMEKIKHFLEYKIIDLENFSLTTYHIALVIAIIILLKLALWTIKKVITRKNLKDKFGAGRQHALYQIIKYVLVIITFVIILESIGIKLTFLFAGSAALLVGLGFGLQQTFNDFISGIILLFEGTIQVDDIIEVEGVVGKVKRIGIRTSEIETRDNIELIIPNSKFTLDKVINWSHNKQSTRFRVSVGVAYGSDVELVRKVLLECAGEHEFIVKEPAPRVRFRDFADSSLNFDLLFFSEDMFRRGLIESDLRFLIDKKFREKGISIPFPQRDVHLYQDSIKALKH